MVVRHLRVGKPKKPSQINDAVKAHANARTKGRKMKPTARLPTPTISMSVLPLLMPYSCDSARFKHGVYRVAQ